MERGKYNGVVCAGLFLLFIGSAESQNAQQPQPIQQGAPSTPTQQVSPNQTTLQAFQQGQQALTQSLQALLAQNPTPQQMQAWQQQNATSLANQQQLAQSLAADLALQPLDVVVMPQIPANAPQAVKDFITTQVALANARAQIHNQLLNALPVEPSDDQIRQMQQSEVQLFQQQQGANLQLQARQAKALANESAQQPVPLPPPLVLPPGTTPQMAAYLTARDQLMRDRINYFNQYVTATPAAREAAMAQWMQQNANRFLQIQALAQQLSPPTSTTQN